MIPATFSPHRAVGCLVVASCLAAPFASAQDTVEGGLVPEIAFVIRDPRPAPPSERGRTVVSTSVSGKLVVRAPGGSLRTLVDATAPDATQATPTDVLGPDVSYDGKRVVFAGFSPRDDAWRIYEVDVNGEGLRQVTHSDRDVSADDLSRYGDLASEFAHYDDLDPCYLPDGRICFVSTRYPGSAPVVRSRATNLYVVNTDGTDTHRITSERFGADSPAVDPLTGKIVYSRWWHTPGSIPDSAPENTQDPDVPESDPDNPVPIPTVPVYYPPRPNRQTVDAPSSSSFSNDVIRGITDGEFTGVNTWFLSSINPDGTGLEMFNGVHLDRESTNGYRPAFSRDGTAVGLFLTHAPVYGEPADFGLREYPRGIAFSRGIGGPQQFGEAPGASFRYSSVAVLPDGTLLVTGSEGAAGEPGSVDVFRQRRSGRLERLHTSAETVELDAVPLVSRRIPPVIADTNVTRMRDVTPRTVEEAREEGGTFLFLVENIFANAGVDELIPNAPPIGKSLDIEFYMMPQRQSFPAADEPILIKRVEIPQAGQVEVELPAGVPLFEVLRRKDDSIAVGRDGQVFHVSGQNFGRAGETARCVGCHAGHSTMTVPHEPRLTNVAPSAVVTASSVKTLRDNEFRPELLVDRRTDFFRSEWAASDGDEKPSLRFRWGVPVSVRELVVYGAKTDRLGVTGDRTQMVRGVTVRGSVLGQEVFEESFDSNIVPGGTRLPMNGLYIDEMELTVDGMLGLFEGSQAPALAEVEIIGSVAPTASPAQFFVRGDADCTGAVGLSDAIVSLGSLFQGERLCCAAATDVNDDGRLNLTDPVYLLNHLFTGGESPPSPFPACGTAVDRSLVCDVEVCR